MSMRLISVVNDCDLGVAGGLARRGIVPEGCGGRGPAWRGMGGHRAGAAEEDVRQPGQCMISILMVLASCSDGQDRRLCLAAGLGRHVGVAFGRVEINLELHMSSCVRSVR